MPGILGLLHGKYATPHGGIWILTVVSALLGIYGVTRTGRQPHPDHAGVEHRHVPRVRHDLHHRRRRLRQPPRQAPGQALRRPGHRGADEHRRAARRRLPRGQGGRQLVEGRLHRPRHRGRLDRASASSGWRSTRTSGTPRRSSTTRHRSRQRRSRCRPSARSSDEIGPGVARPDAFRGRSASAGGSGRGGRRCSRRTTVAPAPRRKNRPMPMNTMPGHELPAGVQREQDDDADGDPHHRDEQQEARARRSPADLDGLVGSIRPLGAASGCLGVDPSGRARFRICPTCGDGRPWHASVPAPWRTSVTGPDRDGRRAMSRRAARATGRSAGRRRSAATASSRRPLAAGQAVVGAALRPRPGPRPQRGLRRRLRPDHPRRRLGPRPAVRRGRRSRRPRRRRGGQPDRGGGRPRARGPPGTPGAPPARLCAPRSARANLAVFDAALEAGPAGDGHHAARRSPWPAGGGGRPRRRQPRLPRPRRDRAASSPPTTPGSGRCCG